jgi:hypothetical protein
VWELVFHVTLDAKGLIGVVSGNPKRGSGLSLLSRAHEASPTPLVSE